jgi:NADPH-dependent 2,4-dienoyl-CoA reductase/sulfur reductase-like enzyme/nitrite reductase/ring-hydroxylating ferredoxin subunit
MPTMATGEPADLSKGIALQDIRDGSAYAGKVGDDDVIIVRSGDALFAVAAACTHYSGPLADGLVVGETIRCPLHHACFDLRTGAALRAPALDALACWRVERVGDTVYVRERLEPAPAAAAPGDGPESIVILGGGAAGLAAADMLRRQGYRRTIRLVSADTSPPCDRPNLSKDYLAGTASEDWIPLRSPDYYAERKIELMLGTRATSIEPGARKVHLDTGAQLSYGALLLATGADPIHLDIPGAAADRVHTLRSFTDSKAIIAKAEQAKRVVVLGASFIGLEVAGALRTRGIEVHVVGRESVPMERVLGARLGKVVQALHESHGVVFHLGATIDRVDGTVARISDGSTVDADFIVVGAGVRPATALAEQAGLTLDRGVAVDETLQTSAAGVYAAGDIARWPDPHTGERIRVEHWVVAERQGQAAALNMLGRRTPFDAVPFFWSQHYDVAINYVGHAENWDAIDVDGSPEAHDGTVTYQRGNKTLAVVTIARDLDSLKAERAMELAAGAA